MIEEFKFGKKLLVLSDLPLQELELAPWQVREKHHGVLLKCKIAVGITDEAIKLAETYIEEGALMVKSFNDALHIAMATLFNAGVLASGNFKHFVNLKRIKLYNSINLKLGYRIIEIRTPREILEMIENEEENL